MRITPAIWAGMSESRKDTFDRVLEALGIQRRNGGSLTRAARDADTSVRTVKKYAGEALEKDGSGRYQVRPADRLIRPMRIVTTEGVAEDIVRGSRVASLNARHANAVKYYLSTGDASVLAPFIGKSVAGHPLETDPDRLDELGRRGFLDWLSIYTIHS